MSLMSVGRQFQTSAPLLLTLSTTIYFVCVDSTHKENTDAGVTVLDTSKSVLDKNTDTKIYYTSNSRSDLSPVPVRSAVKSYFTWLIQKLSKRVINKFTVYTSTTWLGKLFQITKS